MITRVPNTDRRSIDLLAIQRQLKAVGIFARLAIRDAKTSHLQHVTPVLGNLGKLCARYSEFNALGNWLRAELEPAASRWIASQTTAEPS